MRLSVLIPFFNEGARLAETAKRLSDALTAAGLDGASCEILLCDDGSTDGCGEAVAAMDMPLVRVLHAPHKGKGGALREGVLAARGDFLFYTDADLAYGEGVALDFLAAFEESRAPIIIGSRTKAVGGYGSYSFWRRAVSRAYRVLLRLCGGPHVSDSQCGCKGYEREVAIALFAPLFTGGFSFEFETLLRAEQMGIPIAERGVRVLSNGPSRVRFLRDGARMLADAVTIRRRVRGEIYHK